MLDPQKWNFRQTKKKGVLEDKYYPAQITELKLQVILIMSYRFKKLDFNKDLKGSVHKK